MVPRQDRPDYALTPPQTRKMRLDFGSKTRRRTLERAKLAELGGTAAALAGIFLGMLLRPQHNMLISARVSGSVLLAPQFVAGYRRQLDR